MLVHLEMRFGQIKEFIRNSRYRVPVIMGLVGSGALALKAAEKFTERFKKKDDSVFEMKNILLTEQAKHYRELNGKELTLKALGFGNDWMTELDWETRVQISKWPWADWFMFNFLPAQYINYTITEDIQTSNTEIYMTEVCPDCYRFIMATTFTLVLAKASIHHISAPQMVMAGFLLYTCIAGLICGESGGLSMFLGNSNMAVGNNRDMNFTVHSVAHKRKKYRLEKYLIENSYNSAQVLVREAHKLEWQLESRIIPMAQVDLYVRGLSLAQRKELGAENWDFGRPYPEEEHIERLMKAGLRLPEAKSSDPLPFSDKDTADLSEMEMFMMKLSKQLDDESDIKKMRLKTGTTSGEPATGSTD